MAPTVRYDRCCNPFGEERHLKTKGLRTLSEALLAKMPNLTAEHRVCGPCRRRIGALELLPAAPGNASSASSEEDEVAATSGGAGASSLPATATPADEEPTKKRGNVRFGGVTVYFFLREQGFSCVPSKGGSTLGMSAAHAHVQEFTLAEHAAEQRRVHCPTSATDNEDSSDDSDGGHKVLLPVPAARRRTLLKAAGVNSIDSGETVECRELRKSRSKCGCECKGICDPESCACSTAHVECQVDEAGFACSCTREGCANSSGRRELDRDQIRTHRVQTLERQKK